MHWQKLDLGDRGLAAVFRDETHYFGWVTSKSGKAFTAWAPPDNANERTAVNIWTDGKFLGVYMNSADAMDVVRVKCTPNN